MATDENRDDVTRKQREGRGCVVRSEPRINTASGDGKSEDRDSGGSSTLLK